MHDNDIILKVDEKPAASQWFWSLISTFVCHVWLNGFGANFSWINPAIALLSSGLGTLSHMSVTKFKVPAYMGSSFAYIGAMTLLMKNGGMPAIAQGAMTGGLVYLIVALIVKFAGKGWIDKVLPPIVVGQSLWSLDYHLLQQQLMMPCTRTLQI